MVATTKKLSRRGQWNGRRRSGREHPGLWHRPALARLGVVGLATAVITLMAWYGGPPLAYRVGEVYPFELRVRTAFVVLNQLELVNQTQPAPVLADDKRVPPGTLPGKTPTQRPVVETYPSGYLIV